MFPFSSFVGLATAILNPLYTSRESADIISPFIFFASSTANLLFPVAVGDAIAITFDFSFIV